MFSIPRLMIAAPHSGAGKTTVTLALLMALRKRGASPAAFKCGPDYIDPMFHREVLGIPSHNLDRFLASEDTVRGLLCAHAPGHGIAVIEGVMGYYDGLGATARASSHELAQATQTPVLLVVSTKGASLSLAALIKGFAGFKKPSQIAGVILNECPEKLFIRLKETLESETGLPLFGYLPRLPECGIQSRHLGLVTAAEIEGLKKKLALLCAQAEQSIDIDALLNLARSARPLQGRLPDIRPVAQNRPCIAVAQDAAFCFYYTDNLALLEHLGAQIAPFSPLQDAVLPPNAAALYLGGGYPELYAKALSENRSMREAIRKAVGRGMPTLAECGGFLYLHDTLEDGGGGAYPMAGVLRGHGYKTPRLQRFGYITLTAQKDTLLCPAGEAIPAHEFHYWDSTHAGSACMAQKPDGRAWACVEAGDTLFAGFPHLYFYSNPDFAARFVKAAATFAERKEPRQ